MQAGFLRVPSTPTSSATVTITDIPQFYFFFCFLRPSLLTTPFGFPFLPLAALARALRSSVSEPWSRVVGGKV